MRSFFDCVDREPCEITAKDGRGWVLGRIESGLAPGSVNNAAAALRHDSTRFILHVPISSSAAAIAKQAPRLPARFTPHERRGGHSR